MEDTINPGNIMMKFTAPEDLDIRSVTSRVTENVTDKATDTLDETSFKILNLIAVDPAYTLCKIATDETKVQQEHGVSKDKKEQHRQFREISRIALKNRILSTALYLHVTPGKSVSKRSTNLLPKVHYSH